MLASPSVSSSVSPKITLGCIAAAALLAASISGCGGGEAQDANEPSGNYEVEISKVSFPRRQGLGETSQLKITVQNVGQNEIPDEKPESKLWIVVWTDLSSKILCLSRI